MRPAKVSLDLQMVNRVARTYGAPPEIIRMAKDLYTPYKWDEIYTALWFGDAASSSIACHELTALYFILQATHQRKESFIIETPNMCIGSEELFLLLRESIFLGSATAVQNDVPC